MTREEMRTRDAELVAAYYEGIKPTALATRYAITVAGVFLILKRSGNTTRVYRDDARGNVAADRDAVVLTANGFCKHTEKANRFLRQADEYQRNPHQFMLREIGITPAKLAEVNKQLQQIKAYVTMDAPYSIFFTTRNAFLSLTFRQLLLFVANPFAYIMAHKDEVRDFNGMLKALAQPEQQ